MSKKLFKERKFNLGIVESYKKITEQDSPILGSFNVKGMTVENMVSQNKTKYSKDVWQQPTAFGQNGKFLDANGKLKPATLFGSVDHPIDNRAELLLQEAAIAWHDVQRNSNGSWDGSAHILNNPQGRIVKTFLDYAKQFGGGDLLGVSSRALGESVLSESNGEQIEAIVADSFELMSFDFVYNPSFQTAVAHLNESTKTFKKNTLAESVRNLAKDDENHAEVYTNFADKIETINKEIVSMNKEIKVEGNSLSNAKQNYLKELRDQEKKLHDALYELKSMTEEEFAEKGQGEKSKLMKVLKKEYNEVLTEVEALEAAAEPKTESIEKEEVVEQIEEVATEEVEKATEEVVTEATEETNAEVITEAEEGEEDAEEDMMEELEDAAEEMAEELSDEKEEELEIEAEEMGQDDLAAVKEELTALKDMIQELRDFLMPVEAPELEIEDMPEEDMPEEDMADEEAEELGDQADELTVLDEKDLEELSDEELEYLAGLDL